MLTHFCKSVNDFYRYYVEGTESPPAPKRQMVIGSAVHKILLERTAPMDCLAIYPDDCLKSNGHINPVPAKKFEEANADRFVVKREDAELIISVCDSVESHELSGLLANDEAVFETPQFWKCEHSGLDCRLMCDFYFDMGDYILAYDLKTTETIYPARIKRTCKDFKYWLQDAHYSAGLKTLFGKPVHFKFWFVEITYPFRIAPFEYLPQARETANTFYRGMMKRLAECYRNNSWDDDFTQKVNYLNLEPWEVDANEEGEVAYVSED